MKKRIRLLALLLLIVITISSMTSCDVLMGLIQNQHTPSGPENPPANQPSDKENENTPTQPEQPETPIQTVEPTEAVDPEEERKSALYGYLPVISNNMPVIHINTEDGSNEWATKYGKSDKTAGNIDYVDATISVNNCEEDYEMTDVATEVKVRGNATLNYAKKPIRIKFSKKNNLLGLHEGEKYKNWVLLADWKDLSMSNNTVAFYLGNTILGSDGYYCTDFRNVEVYLNGQYWGVYLLVEQQEVKDGRTSVPEVEDDYTGTDIGYLFEYDGYYTEEGTSYLDGGEGDPTFTMSYPSGAAHRGGIGYTVKSDLYTKDQLNFLRTYLNNAFYIAFEATKGNFYKFDENYNVVADNAATNAKAVINSVIDIQSLVDIYILNEIACDLDVDWSSFYLSLNMTSDGNKKITFEAPWDWDSCFGLRVDIDKAVPNAQGMYASTRSNPWFRLVTGQDWFWNMVREKWSELKKYGVLENAVTLVMDQKVIYSDYYKNNYQKWSTRVTSGNNEVTDELNSYKDINTAQGLAADYLIKWLNARFVYLDSQWIIEGERSFEEVKNQTASRPSNAKAYRFEAEDAELSGFATDSPIRENKHYASGRSYVADMYEGSSLSFTFDLKKTTTIYIYVCVSKRNEAYDFNSCFNVSVNGKKVSAPIREIPTVEGGEEEWHSFACIRLTTALVGAGENTITFTAVSDTASFDYIEIYSPEEIS